MRIRTLTMAVGVVLLTASMVSAAGLTEGLQTERLTVLKVDHAAGQFQCAEHRRWITVAKDSIARVRPGDIVRLERANGRPARVVVLRAAADELASPE